MGLSGRQADGVADEVVLSEEVGSSVIIGSSGGNADGEGIGCSKGPLPEVVAGNIVLGSSGK